VRWDTLRCSNYIDPPAAFISNLSRRCNIVITSAQGTLYFASCKAVFVGVAPLAPQSALAEEFINGGEEKWWHRQPVRHQSRSQRSDRPGTRRST